MNVPYDVWAEKTESTQTMEISRDIIRDIYPVGNGINIAHNVCLPRNPFKSQSEWAYVCYTLHISDKPKVLAAGGSWNEEMYTEEGYGTPEFFGDDCLKKAYEFALTLKQ